MKNKPILIALVLALVIFGSIELIPAQRCRAEQELRFTYNSIVISDRWTDVSKFKTDCYGYCLPFNTWQPINDTRCWGVCPQSFTISIEEDFPEQVAYSIIQLLSF